MSDTLKNIGKTLLVLGLIGSVYLGFTTSIVDGVIGGFSTVIVYVLFLAFAELLENVANINFKLKNIERACEKPQPEAKQHMLSYDSTAPKRRFVECRQCGLKNGADELFCTKCGQKL